MGGASFPHLVNKRSGQLVNYTTVAGQNCFTAILRQKYYACKFF
jgi:NADP-dependent 3-hydroxy acid dehydrogenase YdfG